MKQELYYYAISLKNKGLSNIPISCCWIILGIFVLPVILTNIIFGLILLFTYLLLYFFSKKCADKYNQELLNMGLFMLFLGIASVALTLTLYDLLLPLVITTFVCLIAYETILFIKIKKKIFSKPPKKSPSWMNFVTPACGFCGVYLGRLISKIASTDIKIWLVVLVCSLFITYSFDFFQKFFIHKVVKK